MILKRLATFLKQDKKSEQRPSDKQLALTREFESVANSLVDVFGKDFTDYIIESWHYNESSLAIESLMDNLLENEPPLSEKLQERIAVFAEMEDQWNEQRWQKYKAEMTTEQMEKYHIKDCRTRMLADFRGVYPKGSSPKQPATANDPQICLIEGIEIKRDGDYIRVYGMGSDRGHLEAWARPIDALRTTDLPILVRYLQEGMPVDISENKQGDDFDLGHYSSLSRIDNNMYIFLARPPASDGDKLFDELKPGKNIFTKSSAEPGIIECDHLKVGWYTMSHEEYMQTITK